ncbi:MAG: phosphodiester glycosidase family protein [Muribaculaceae bacterium]|nr:phosphodiester glycosidase family protein [Muribaculaceae bacterium]
MQKHQRIIDVDDEIRNDDRPQDIPVITIEEDSDRSDYSAKDYNSITTRETKRVRRRIMIFTIVLLCLGLLATILWGYRYYTLTPEVESSISDNENIESLKSSAGGSSKGTTVTSDSVLGVAFDMYSLKGLHASLEREVPDTSDGSLVLFMRSSDYHPDGSILGNIIINGEEKESKDRKGRAGYVAISKNGNLAIGISLNDKMSDYLKENGGSFFRQYVLLGDGELPSTFALHGKVERAALGRMYDGNIYYVTTRNKETMYDFADALREYGFTDAVYLTGGNSYAFHRSPDGVAHIPEATKEKIEKYRSTSPIAPMLVFRNIK